jgi:hypothetical protein
MRSIYVRRRAAWMNDTLADLATVEGLLLLEQDGIALIRNTSDVEGVAKNKNDMSVAHR